MRARSNLISKGALFPKAIGSIGGENEFGGRPVLNSIGFAGGDQRIA